MNFRRKKIVLPFFEKLNMAYLFYVINQKYVRIRLYTRVYITYYYMNTNKLSCQKTHTVTFQYKNK